MTHDNDYFRRRAAEARASAFHKDDGEGVEVAGHLALAYAALARRGQTSATGSASDAAVPAAVYGADAAPLMLRD